MNASFYAGREQTLIKHKLLRRYLRAALPILGSWAEDLYYIDCLAGPWENVDNAFSDTSFFIAIEELQKTASILRARGRSPRMRALFIERDNQRFLRLDSFTRTISGVDAIAKDWDFANSVSKIVTSVKKRNKSFPFFFIDPTGWETAGIPVITPILQVKPGEVLINLMTSWISRFLRDQAKPFDTILGPGHEWIADLHGDDREEAIVRAYSEAVRTAGGFPYVCTMPVLKSTDESFHFRMVYATRHPKGLEEFKKAENDVVPFMHCVRAEAKQTKDLLRTQQLHLLAPADTYVDERYSRYKTINLKLAGDVVLGRLQRSLSVPFDELWADWMQFACLQDDDLQNFLRVRQRDGILTFRNVPPKSCKLSRDKGITVELISAPA